MSFLGNRVACLVLFLVLFGCSRDLHGEGFTLPDARDPIAGMGVNIHFTDARPGELEMLSRAGFHWIRLDLAWNQIEKTREVYDFSAYDRLMASLDKFHIRALLILDYTNGLYDGNKPPYTEEGRAAFARWAVAVTTHFKNRGVIWEIWNEPNGGWFWNHKANADDYAKLALTVSKAIHETTPDEVIVGPALAGSDMAFVEVSARMGVLAYWSAITIHPYVHSEPENYGPAYDLTHQLIQKYTLPGQRIEVMCGESGYTTTWPGIDEETQGKYLARLFLFDVMSGVPLTIWYDWHDDGNNPKDRESNFGIVHFDYHSGAATVYDPKPAYLAAQTYFHELNGYRYEEAVTTKSKGDFVLCFNQGADSCIVAWTSAPTPHEMMISEPDGSYEVTSYDGKKQTEVQAVHGTITLTLDGGPQYIKHK